MIPIIKGYGEERHLQRLDVLELIGVPLFDLLVLPCCEEQMSLGDKLEEHDAAERTNRGREEREGQTSDQAKKEI